jgi:catechol 2,3-dioxygenase-like lactoylglutathione lyase family enzyme
MPLVPGRRTPSLRLALLALVTLVAPALSAQIQTQTPPLAGVAHVAIRVRDLAASRAFYEKLGFQQAFDLERNGVPYESFIKINDHQFIELYPVDEKNPEPAFLHVCFEGVDLNSIHDDYVSHGLTPTPVRKAGAGNLLFTLRGPENQNIEYTQYQPGSLHSNDQGKHLGSDRVADTIFAVALAMRNPAEARDFYLNQLQFKSIAGDPMFLHMPGDSGQEIEIAAYPTLTTRARLTLRTPSLSRSAHLLHKQEIKLIKADNSLTLADPDGNVLIIRAE